MAAAADTAHSRWQTLLNNPMNNKICFLFGRLKFLFYNGRGLDFGNVIIAESTGKYRKSKSYQPIDILLVAYNESAQPKTICHQSCRLEQASNFMMVLVTQEV